MPAFFFGHGPDVLNGDLKDELKNDLNDALGSVLDGTLDDVLKEVLGDDMESDEGLDHLKTLITGTALLAAVGHVKDLMDMPDMEGDVDEDEEGLPYRPGLLALTDEELDILGGQKGLDEFRERLARDLKRLGIKRDVSSLPDNLWDVVVRLYMIDTWQEEEDRKQGRKPEEDSPFLDQILKHWDEGALSSGFHDKQREIMTALMFDATVDGADSFPYKRRLMDRMEDLLVPESASRDKRPSDKTLTTTTKALDKAPGKASGKNAPTSPEDGKRLVPGLLAPEALANGATGPANKPANKPARAGARTVSLEFGTASGMPSKPSTARGKTAGTSRQTPKETPKETPKKTPSQTPRRAEKPAPRTRTPFVPTITPPFDPERPTAEGIQELYRLANCDEDVFAYKLGVGKTTAQRWLEAKGEVHLTKDSLKKISKYQLTLLKKIAGAK